MPFDTFYDQDTINRSYIHPLLSFDSVGLVRECRMIFFTFPKTFVDSLRWRWLRFLLEWRQWNPITVVLPFSILPLSFYQWAATKGPSSSTSMGNRNNKRRWRYLDQEKSLVNKDDDGADCWSESANIWTHTCPIVIVHIIIFILTGIKEW